MSLTEERSAGALDVPGIRADFPVLERTVGDKPLVYLDSAATSQKPRQVLDVLNAYYERYNANVHRGVHVLAEEATAEYEGARDKVAAFINAPSRDEVIFTKNILNDSGDATINLNRMPGSGGVTSSGALVTLMFQAAGRGTTTVSVPQFSPTNSQPAPLLNASPLLVVSNPDVVVEPGAPPSEEYLKFFEPACDCSGTTTLLVALKVGKIATP